MNVHPDQELLRYDPLTHFTYFSRWDRWRRSKMAKKLSGIAGGLCAIGLLVGALGIAHEVGKYM